MSIRRFNMKATGMIRRIDDLGRLVVPKEVRRVLDISESDPFEVYADIENDAVIFTKYYHENPISTALHKLEKSIKDDEDILSGKERTDFLANITEMKHTLRMTEER